MHQIRCGEVWGGIRNHDEDVMTSGITASLHSGAADGGQGGDIYYFSVCDSDLLTRIAIADVMGHGEAVTRTSRWLYEALVAHMNRADGNSVLEYLNQLSADYGYTAITTAIVVGFYLSDNNLYFSYAGHPPILIRRRGERQWKPADLPEHPGACNLPLGVDAAAPYDLGLLPLRSGDRLFLCTDGVLEAPDPRDQLFGLDRLQALLHDVGDESLPDIKSAVLSGLRRHTVSELVHDDVTMMIVEIR